MTQKRSLWTAALENYKAEFMGFLIRNWKKSARCGHLSQIWSHVPVCFADGNLCCRQCYSL